jgi:hypothetical protein
LEKKKKTIALHLVVVVVVVVVGVLASSKPSAGRGSLVGRGEMARSLSSAAAIAVVLLCISGLCRGAERLGTRECEELGFTGLALCSDCNALGEFVKDQGTSRAWLARPCICIHSSCDDDDMVRDLDRAGRRGDSDAI